MSITFWTHERSNVLACRGFTHTIVSTDKKAERSQSMINSRTFHESDETLTSKYLKSMRTGEGRGCRRP